MKKIRLLSVVKIGIFLILGLTTLDSCHRNAGVVTYDETSTRGNIHIGVDESFKLILDTEIFTFESIYNYAKINASYKPELDILKAFMDDSIGLWLLPVNLQRMKNNF